MLIFPKKNLGCLSSRRKLQGWVYWRWCTLRVTYLKVRSLKVLVCTHEEVQKLIICQISTEINGNRRVLGPKNTICNNRCLSAASGASLTLNARPKIHLSAVSTTCKGHKLLKKSYKNNSKITKKHIVKYSLTNSGAKDSFIVAITEGQGFQGYIRNRQVLIEELLELV